MTHGTLLALAAGLFIGADAPKGDLEADLKKLDGIYTLASGLDDGKKIPDDVLKGAKLFIKGDTHYVKVGGATYSGKHTIDADKKPKTIDIKDTAGPFKDMTVLGIYSIDGDDFKICYAPPGKDRPKDFEAKEGSGNHLHVWKREKK